MHHDTTSQSKEILKALLKGERLTRLCILTRFGCMNAPGRICELRQQGHPIIDRWVNTAYSKKRIKEYFIIRKTA
jgi:hypothetical protein